MPASTPRTAPGQPVDKRLQRRAIRTLKLLDQVAYACASRLRQELAARFESISQAATMPGALSPVVELPK